jgi:DAACS family dicarboxylate/amino acid:cation (Na+ or H+) symporter
MSTAEHPSTPGRRGIPLHTKIFVGLLIGAAIGLTANWLVGQTPDGEEPSSARWKLEWVARNIADPIGKVFLRLIFMIVIPLVFSALTLGVVGLGDLRRLGRVGVRTLGFTVILSMIAVGLGITLVNVIRPGSGLSAAQRDVLKAQYAGDAGTMVQKADQAKSLKDTLLDIIPENPLQEMVGAIDGSSKGNGMLSVMFFALVCGAALTTVAEGKRQPLVSVLEAIFDACMAVIAFAMRLAPLAVMCLVFAVTSRLGVDVIKVLFWFALTVVLALSIHLFVVYSVTIRLFAGMSPRAFFSRSSEAMLTAFATSSSNATLPTALRVAENDLGLPKEISHFVLTVGATGNQNGTALYEGVVVLFLAQVFGVDLTFSQQIVVVLMSILAGVGTAGVPGGSLPLIVILLKSVGVPAEGIAIILGVDRVLDMCRTVLNVTGDLAITACVSRSERERMSGE